MAQLLEVRINRKEKTAIFSGDTYNAKEKIKSLGKALFNGADKTWKVLSFTISVAELEDKFSRYQHYRR